MFSLGPLKNIVHRGVFGWVLSWLRSLGDARNSRPAAGSHGYKRDHASEPVPLASKELDVALGNGRLWS